MQQEGGLILLPEQCKYLLESYRYLIKAGRTQSAELKSRAQALSPNSRAAFEQRPRGVSEGKGPSHRTCWLCRDSRFTNHRHLGVHTVPSPTLSGIDIIIGSSISEYKGPGMYICMRPCALVRKGGNESPGMRLEEAEFWTAGVASVVTAG